MPAGIITSSGIPWDIYERDLDDVTRTTVTEVFNWVPRLFKVIPPRKYLEIRERTWAGMTDAEPWEGDGDEVPISGIASRYKITAEYGFIANSIEYTYKMKTFDEYNLLKDKAVGLRESVETKTQKSAVGYLCGGFSGTWGTDPAITEPLFSDLHTFDPRYAGSGTFWSNIVSGAPSVGALMDAINLLILTPDDLGNPGTYLPTFLLCATGMVMVWRQILGFPGKTAERADTANHTPNPFGEYNITVVGCPWIDQISPDMWYLYSNKTDLIWETLVGIDTWMHEAKNKSTEHLAMSCFRRFARGPRGIVGSEG